MPVHIVSFGDFLSGFVVNSISKRLSLMVFKGDSNYVGFKESTSLYRIFVSQYSNLKGKTLLVVVNILFLVQFISKT